MLSVLLDGHPEITSVGEIAFLHQEWSYPQRSCACGSAYSDCSFWGELSSDPARREVAADLTRRIERITHLPWLWARSRAGGRALKYRRVQRSLFLYVRERTAASVVVDASKCARAAAGRALALAEIAGLEVYVLHLVRSGRSTLESLVTTGGNWTLEGHIPPRRFPALRGTLGWVAANLCAAALRRRLGEDRYMRIRYEDLVSDPGAGLESIGRFLGLNMSPVIHRVQTDGAFEVGHLVGGNRLRFSSHIRLKTTPSRTKRRVHLLRRLPFVVLGTWLERAYGYRE